MLRIYDEFLEDETILGLHDRAYRLHVSALIYCSRNLTDGRVTAKGVKVLQVLLGFPVKRFVAELVEAGVWVVEGEDHRIRNYLEFNPDAATVKAEKKKARERMRKLREKRTEDCSPERSGERDGERSLQYQSSPVLSFELPLKAVAASEEIEHEVDKILKQVRGADGGTRGVLLSVARKLPLSSVAKVRESCSTRLVSAGYAVNALRSELADIEEVA